MTEHKFNPNEHLMAIKSRNGNNDYLPVQWRLVWFRECCPDGEITTEIVHLDLDHETEEETYQYNQETRRSEKVTKRALGFAVCRATVKDGRGGVATGTKSEKAASFGDFLEKAETGAIGRALAALGYGTQFTGEEFDEHHRIVDAPVDHAKPAASTTTAKSGSQDAAQSGLARANELAARQASLEKKREQARSMAEKLGMKCPPLDKLNEAALDDLIGGYKREHAERQHSQKAEAAAHAEMAKG